MVHKMSTNSKLQQQQLFTVLHIKQILSIFSYRPLQNSNDKGSVTSGHCTVDLCTQTQDMLDTFQISTGDRVVKETLLAYKLCVCMLLFHSLPETTEVLFRKQTQNAVAVLLICEMKRTEMLNRECVELFMIVSGSYFS